MKFIRTFLGYGVGVIAIVFFCSGIFHILLGLFGPGDPIEELQSYGFETFESWIWMQVVWGLKDIGIGVILFFLSSKILQKPLSLPRTKDKLLKELRSGLLIFAITAWVGLSVALIWYAFMLYL